MVTWNNDIRVPVIVETGKDMCNIEIPDLNITVHGTDYISAIANAVNVSTALYYYNLEHNLPFELKYTLSDVEQMVLRNKKKRCFATAMCLSE